MDEERLREWVEKKLDDGISEDRIRKSLRNTGHDPSIVDEVQDPFSSDKEEEGSLDLSKETGEDQDTDNSEKDLDSTESTKQGGKDAGSGFDFSGESPDSGHSSHENVDREDSGSKESFSLPRPSLSVPSIPLKAVAVFIGTAIAIGGYFLAPPGLVPEMSLNKVSTPDVKAPEVKAPDLPDFSSDNEGINDESSGSEVKDAECDVGLRINSVSSDGGSTRAEIFVTRGTTDVVLEIYTGDSLEGSSTERIGGTGSLTVRATGDTAVLHPEGCEKPRTSAPIN